MVNKNLFKKAALASVIVFTMGTTTACTLKFKEDLPVNKDISDTQVTAITETAEKIEDVIENTDFTDDASIEIMSEAVATYSTDLSEDLDNTFEEAMVKRVVDGDTIVVNIEGSGEYKVRFIGVNTPESVASEEYLEKKGTENSEEGHLASDYTKSLLEEGEIVYLQMDTSDTDCYGRLLRYVWLEIPEDAYDLDEISEKMVNGILLKEGYAEAVYYAPDGMYKEYFETLEENYENSEREDL